MNLYEDTAHLYDLDPAFRQLSEADIPFYAGYAGKYRGNILDIGCGTGRVLIPLALKGYTVFVIDLSDGMLAQFVTKMQDLTPTVKDRITTWKFNVSGFKLDGKFSLIVIPCRSFQCLTTEQDQRGCLKSVLRPPTC
jgi:SAM-dependent methyltransferase